MNAPLLVLYDPRGGITDTGERGPLWSSDCRPAPTLKALCGELLQAGWPLSTMLQLPAADEPVRFIDVYKREFDGKTPKNFEKFRREAQIQQHMKDHAGGDYGINLPSSNYGRSDYGGNL